MKILLVNYRYFISGGPEKYMFNVKALLEKKGHQVFPFSVQSEKNVFSEYSDYFVSPIGGMDSVYYDDVKKTPRTILQLLSRSIYSFEVKHAVQKEIKELKPDLVYVIHFVNKLSPSVIVGAKELGIPVVLRLSDYFMLCPRFDFIRDKKICEDCLKKGYYKCIKHKCVKNSFFASLVRVFSMKIHGFLHVYDKVDAFVAPSEFLRQKLVKQGYAKEKIHCIPTFTSFSSKCADYSVGSYGLYFGRIVEEKGIETAIKAYEGIFDQDLIIMGDDTTTEAERLKKYVVEHRLGHIHFVGPKSGEALEEIIDGARFVIIPSIWYDNLPNTALEAFGRGKPVIASDIGSLPELITEGENGFLFKPGNEIDLREKIGMLQDDKLVRQMGENAIRYLKHHFSEEEHYEKLIKLFRNLIS